MSDGGYAFPTGLKVGEIAKMKGGMTLREYFAGQALAGILANHSIASIGYKPKMAAEDAVDTADAMIAMLAERNEVE